MTALFIKGEITFYLAFRFFFSCCKLYFHEYMHCIQIYAVSLSSWHIWSLSAWYNLKTALVPEKKQCPFLGGVVSLFIIGGVLLC